MERLDGKDLGINSTYLELGPECWQLLGVHDLVGCDSASHPYERPWCPEMFLRKRMSRFFSILDKGRSLYATLYDLFEGTRMTEARIKIFVKNRGIFFANWWKSCVAPDASTLASFAPEGSKYTGTFGFRDYWVRMDYRGCSGGLSSMIFRYRNVTASRQPISGYSTCNDPFSSVCESSDDSSDKNPCDWYDKPSSPQFALLR